MLTLDFQAVAIWVLERREGPASATVHLANEIRRRAEGVTPRNLLSRLKAIGPAGVERAAEFEGASFDLWTDPARTPEAQRWVRGIGLALWDDVVRHKVPAVVRPVALAFASLCSRPFVGLEPAPGVRLQVVQGRPPEQVESAIPGLPLLGTVTAHRLFRFLIRCAYDAENHDAPRVIVEGGWTELARLIGARSNKAIEELRAICNALACTAVVWDLGPAMGASALLEWFQDRPASRAGRAVLELRPSRVLTPGFVHQVAKGSADRHLVPVLPLPSLDGVNPRLQPAAARLDWCAMVELRARAAELADAGSVALDWRGMAEQVGFPVDQLPRLLPAWSDRWATVGAGRWTLAETDNEAAPVLAFLRVAGARSTTGRKGGNRAASRHRINESPRST
jgi:hypothetical protein